MKILAFGLLLLGRKIGLNWVKMVVFWGKEMSFSGKK